MSTPPKEAPFDETRRKSQDGILPLAVRQRLWDQLWTRLLAPPPASGDRAPTQLGQARDPEQR